MSGDGGFGKEYEPQITSEGWCLSLLTFCSASNFTELTNESYAGYLSGVIIQLITEKSGTDLTACEHEILPYQDTEFIADIVEYVRFIGTSTPDTNHVLVPGDQKLEPLQVFVVSKSAAIGQTARWMKAAIRTLLGSYRPGSS